MARLKFSRHMIYTGALATLCLLILNTSTQNKSAPEQFFSLSQLKPQDPQYAAQQSALNTIELEKAWDINTGSKNIVVAVIDDAININHPDLRDNIGPGWDFVDGDNDPSPGSCNNNVTGEEKVEAHGTLVSGVIAAVGNNNIGISGVNWNVTLMPLRIGCFYSSSKEAQAIEYAISHGADIINLSYGGPAAYTRTNGNADIVKNIIEAAKDKVLVVASAGNQHINNDDVDMFPAGLKLDNVISVAASDNNRQLSEWSQYGPASVDVAAPGVDLQTTRARINFGDEAYATVSGTSFSAPVVSGLAALIKARNLQEQTPTLSPADIKAIIQASTSSLNQSISQLKTDGLVNAFNALQMLNAPRPVITLEDYVYDDASGITSSTSFQNGLIDPDESGILRITLKNLWDNALNTSVTLSSEDKTISLSADTQNVGQWPVGESKELAFQLNTGNFSGNKRFVFQLSINAIGERGSSQVTRHFFLNTGYLENLKVTNALIQKDNYDEYQYFHLNVPAGSQKVAVEVEYNTNDARDIGLLASLNKKPLIHFRERNGQPYWYDAQRTSDLETGFERIDMNITSFNAATLRALVFNQPNSAVSSVTYNKAFTIRGCYFSEDDGNVAPKVNAGKDRTVLAGSVVKLNGVVSDVDGSINRVWWQSNNGVRFISSSGENASFIAPSSGDLSFSLTAIDDGCKLSRDSVRIIIENEVGEIPGFQLNPSKIVIEENSSIDLIVTAMDGLNRINSLTLLSAPEGVKFVKGNGRSTSDRISWQNVGPVGTYLVKFSTILNGNTETASILIEVVSRNENRGGGGCSTASTSGFDPLFWIYVVLSLIYLRRKPTKQRIS